MNQIKCHHIPVIKTAHYATFGEIGQHIKTIWIVCHGYGQLAKIFIRRFLPIMDEDPFITPKRMEMMQNVINESGLVFQEFPFMGVHKVEKKALLEWKMKFQKTYPSKM